ncbi:ATP-binding protein [Candidatus Woesearchaeota archaeon]|nr:MAG: ATP-binding protein [Candidatus Woesearchaeota archaeon]
MKYFKDKPKGVVVSMDSENSSDNVYSVWFDYTKSYVLEIKVGSFIAVRNFNSSGSGTSFSILEVVSVFPKHYALGSSAKDTERAFPGFVVEAARNAKVDWEQDEPIEQTTKIKAETISTGLQLVIQNSGSSKLENDDSLPMIGEDAHLLTDEQVNMIVNRGLIDGSVKTISPCNLILNKDVSVKLSTEDLLKTHFGIFGFTGAGKSNLLSELMANLLQTTEPNKVVLFDFMTEYLALVIDLVHSLDDAYILSLSEDSLPGSIATEAVLRGDTTKVAEAAESIVKTLLLPKELIPLREKYKKIVIELLQKNKIRLFSTGSDMPSVSDLKAKLYDCIKGNLGGSEPHVKKMLEHHLIGSGVASTSEDVLKNLKADVDQAILQDKLIDYTRPAGQATQSSLAPARTSANRTIAVTTTAKNCLINMQTELEKYVNRTKVDPLPENACLSLSQVQAILSKTDKPSILIVQSNRGDDLRNFSSDLVNYACGSRRITGRISPHVVFVYDEADEFIPQGSNLDDSYVASKAACTLLARRGRKFGLGLGIATQRVAYLDTSILSQPHTFLLSKLPREYDRRVIGDAFGASDDMLKRTLSFKKGQWLLFSYDATGLTNVPLPVQFPNANDRIKRYLENK